MADHAAESKSTVKEGGKSAAAKAAAHGHPSHTAKYLKVFFALLVLTGIELVVVKLGLSKTTVILLLIGLAVTKAGAVALYFMHLSDEKRTMKLMIGLPLLFPPLYAVVLIAESIFRSAFTFSH